MMKWLRPGLVIVAALLASTATAAELGRLFFTPTQRATLDTARKQNIRTEIGNESEQPSNAAPTPQNVSVNGLIKRSDGKNTIWLNNRAVTEQHPGPIGAVIGKNDDRVLLNVPESGRKLDLKVGQSVEIVSGTIEESYLRRPAAKAEAKGTGDAEKAASDVAKVTTPANRDAVKSEPGLQRRPARDDNDARGDSRTLDSANRR